VENDNYNSNKRSGKSDLKLNDSITKFFQVLSKSARTKITLRFLLLSFTFLGLSLLVFAISDRITTTTVFWRVLISSTGVVSALWAVFKLITYFYFHTRKLTWLAKCVRKVYRAKGERLLGIIEITEEEKTGNHSFSTQIFEAAQQKMTQEINSLKINEIFSWKKVRVPCASACGILLIIVMAFIADSEISENTFKRWSIPFASIEKKTLTQIRELKENSFTVLKDEANTIRFSLSSSSRIKPNYAELIKSKDSKFRIISKLNGGIYEFNIPPQRENFSAHLIVGDYQKQFSVKTVTRPRMESLTSIVKFPKYLLRNSEKMVSLNNQIEVPKNSEITLKGKANREIFQVQISDFQSSFDENPYSTEFKFNLPTLKHDNKYSLHIVDHFGFSPREPIIISHKIQNDLPPSVNLNPLTDTSPVLLFETRKISFLNEDDFGLKECSLNCSIFRAEKKIKELEIFSENLSKVVTKQFDLSFPFDPNLFDLEDGDIVTFVASVMDNYPEREPTLSKPLKLIIIGSEKHAEMIRAQIDGVIAEIAEIARNQEAVQFETLSAEENVRKSTDQPLNSKQSSEINNLKKDQNDLAKRLNLSTRNGSDIINEAAKNPFFATETLQEFASSLSELKKTSSGSMRESENNLNAASSSNTSEASQSLMRSAASQERALEELRKILAKFSEQLDRLEAKTLAQRLTKLEKTEKKLSIKLVSIMPSSVGKMPSQLDNKNLSSFHEMQKIQTKVTEDADEVKNEISRYHERTQKAEYGKVSQLMSEANLKKGLAGVAQNIRNNISFQALDNLNYWESSFAKWAKLLQQETPGGDSAGGGEGGKDRTADILALLKMRKVQSDILFKTKTIGREGFLGDKNNWSLSLKEQQDSLMIDLTDTQISIAEEALNPLFDDAHMAMSESSEQLAQQIFDKGTQGAQQESKNIISDLINLLLEGQGQGQGTSDNENLTAMELLMMQIGNEQKGQSQGNSPVPGNTGGGSSQGGSVDQVTKSLQGATLAPTKDDSSSKSNSNITPSIAPEFQDAMQKYFKAIED